MALTITDFALQKLKDLARASQSEGLYLRIGLKSGGCSGYSYHVDFEKSITDFDKTFSFDGLNICIDKKSYIFLNGTEIDYEETPFKSGIKFNTPNATRACGCGESISFDT